MVTMVTKQKILDQLSVYETVRDESIPQKNFALLGQGIHEIPVEGWPYPPPPHPPVSDVGSPGN